MAYPAGYSSEEDFDGFLSDNSEDDMPGRPGNDNGIPQEPVELTQEQKVNNFFFSILNEKLTEIILALNDGMDVGVQLRDGWSPILLAASIGNPEIVNELISRGADVNSERDKYTPLMAVCNCPNSTSTVSDRLEVVNALIENGANVNAITRKRQTAFMYAAGIGDLAVLTRLMAICNIEAEDNQGWTALFWAVDNDKPEAVQLLIDAGLHTDKVDIHGNNPIHYAIQQEYEDVIKLLSVQDDEATTYVQSDSLYDIEELFKDLRPQFFRDICSMLYGMKCDQLSTFFSDVELLEFLSLDNKSLVEVGVELPYQRYRILNGLHKFHAHVYKQKSIPIIPKDALYSTVDVGNVLVATIRQLIAMEASLKYVSNICSDDVKSLQICTKTIRTRLTKLKKTGNMLHTLTSKWDSQIEPVDLIEKKIKRKSNGWLKFLGCVGVLSFSFIIFTKSKIQFFDK